MPRGKQYTIDEKAKIQAWMAEDLTFLEMASRLKRDVSGVRKMAASLRQLPVDATPPPAKARSGRPRVTTPRQDEKLRQFIYKCPFKTAKEVKREVPGYRKLSVRRIQAILKERLKIPSSLMYLPITFFCDFSNKILFTISSMFFICFSKFFF